MINIAFVIWQNPNEWLLRTCISIVKVVFNIIHENLYCSSYSISSPCLLSSSEPMGFLYVILVTDRNPVGSDDGRLWVKQNSWNGHASVKSTRSLTPTFDLLIGECRAARETIFLILGSFRLKFPYWNMKIWNFIHLNLFSICWYLIISSVLYVFRYLFIFVY